MHQTIYKLVHKPIYNTVNKLIDASINQPIYKSIYQTIKPQVYKLLTNLSTFSLLTLASTTHGVLDLGKASNFAKRVAGGGDVVDNASSWISFGLQFAGWTFIVIGVAAPLAGVIKAYNYAASGTKTDWTMTKAIGMGFVVFVLCISWCGDFKFCVATRYCYLSLYVLWDFSSLW